MKINCFACCLSMLFISSAIAAPTPEFLKCKNEGSNEEFLSCINSISESDTLVKRTALASDKGWQFVVVDNSASKNGFVTFAVKESDKPIDIFGKEVYPKLIISSGLLNDVVIDLGEKAISKIIGIHCTVDDNPQIQILGEYSGSTLYNMQLDSLGDLDKYKKLKDLLMNGKKLYVKVPLLLGASDKVIVFSIDGFNDAYEWTESYRIFK